MKKYLFIICLFCVSIFYSQQNICFGETRNYSVDLADGIIGTPGSTYAWSVLESDFVGIISGNPSTSGNSISINWGLTPPGTYTLQVIETNNFCEG